MTEKPIAQTLTEQLAEALMAIPCEATRLLVMENIFNATVRGAFSGGVEMTVIPDAADDSLFRLVSVADAMKVLNFRRTMQ